MDLLGKQVKIIEGEKVSTGVIQKLFPSTTDTIINVRLSTGGLKCYNASDLTEDSEGSLIIVVQPEPTSQIPVTKKKGLFGLFRK